MYGQVGAGEDQRVQSVTQLVQGVLWPRFPMSCIWNETLPVTGWPVGAP